MKTLKMVFALAAIALVMVAWAQYANTQTDLRIGTALRAARNGRL